MSKKSKKLDGKKPIDFTTIWDSDYWMHSNGMYCGFNMPDALIDSESTQMLPPYAKRKFYLTDEYPACPKNWVPSEGRKTSYFVPVKEGQGMWLDFTKNESNKYHVAIVVSIQGINPITGLPCKDAALEQYIDTCPKHKESFGPNRFCKSCGYKWPKQNYICTTGTPTGNLWLDGFRAADGIVRQYMLTMDKIRGVASNIINEDRVFAVGISFFFSNSPKPVIMQTNVTRGLYSLDNWNASSTTKNKGSCSKGSCIGGLSSKTNGEQNYNYFTDTASVQSFNYNTPNSVKTSNNLTATLANVDDTYATTMDWIECERSIKLENRGDCLNNEISSPLINIKEIDQSIKSVSVKKIEIGAGANISQQIHDDPEPLEFWRKEPESIILINYCLEESCSEIISAGKISLEGHGESFLKDIPKGNEKKI